MYQRRRKIRGDGITTVEVSLPVIQRARHIAKTQGWFMIDLANTAISELVDRLDREGSTVGNDSHQS